MTDPDVAAIAGKLTKAQRRMLRWSRECWNEPRRCYGPGITKKALRNIGLCHGDLCYLTPLGERVRAYLKGQSE